MALFQVTVQQVYLQQQVINRFTYQSNSTPAAVSLSFGLFSAFSGAAGNVGVVNAMRSIQSVALVYANIEVRNLYSETDFYSTAFNSGVTGGDSTGDAGASFLAAKYTSSRTRLDIRAGTKSFAGITESAVGPGGVWVGNYIPLLDSLKAALGQALSYTDEGEALTYTPVVLGRELYPTSTGTEAYRYYPTLAQQEQFVAGAGVWSYAPRVTTQNSRKVGRGA